MFHPSHLACRHPAFFVSTLSGRSRLSFPSECPIEPHIEKTSSLPSLGFHIHFVKRPTSLVPRSVFSAIGLFPRASTTLSKACARVIQPGIRCAVETCHLWAGQSLWRRLRTQRRHTRVGGLLHSWIWWEGENGGFLFGGHTHTHTHTHTHVRAEPQDLLQSGFRPQWWEGNDRMMWGESMEHLWAVRLPVPFSSFFTLFRSFQVFHTLLMAREKPNKESQDLGTLAWWSQRTLPFKKWIIHFKI